MGVVRDEWVEGGKRLWQTLKGTQPSFCSYDLLPSAKRRAYKSKAQPRTSLRVYRDLSAAEAVGSPVGFCASLARLVWNNSAADLFVVRTRSLGQARLEYA